MSKNRVRDLRVKEKFVVDDVYLNGYARHCGIYATGVYMTLCRHANNNQEAFPSVELMMEKLNISRCSVLRAIKILEDFKIIRVVKRKTEKGTYRLNLYMLLDKSQWAPIQISVGDMDSINPCLCERPIQISVGDMDSINPCLCERPIQVSVGDLKDKATIEGIKNIVDFSFEDIWKRYPNKDGRKAAEKHFHTTVNTEEAWQKINRALDKYLHHLKAENWKRPKNGSTWFNNWQDWVDWEEPGAGSMPQAGKEGETPCKVCGSTDYTMILGGTCGDCRRKQNAKNNPTSVS